MWWQSYCCWLQHLKLQVHKIHHNFLLENHKIIPGYHNYVAKFAKLINYPSDTTVFNSPHKRIRHKKEMGYLYKNHLEIFCFWPPSPSRVKQLPVWPTCSNFIDFPNNSMFPHSEMAANNIKLCRSMSYMTFVLKIILRDFYHTYSYLTQQCLIM